MNILDFLFSQIPKAGYEHNDRVEIETSQLHRSLSQCQKTTRISNQNHITEFSIGQKNSFTKEPAASI